MYTHTHKRKKKLLLQRLLPLEVDGEKRKENTSQTIVMLLHKLLKVFKIHYVERIGLKGQYR